MTVDLDALEWLIAAATPGPWRPAGMGGTLKAARVEIARMLPNSDRPNNAALIIAAVNALPALIAELGEARREAERYRWLRDEAAYMKEGSPYCCIGLGAEGDPGISGPYLDEMIDAARLAGRQE